MCAHHRAAVLRAAAAYLDCEKCDRAPFSVTIRLGGDERLFRCRAWPEEPKEETPPASQVSDGRAGLWLSPLEAKILTALAGGDWLASPRIAEAAGEDCSDAFKAVCSNLVERKLLESAPGRGYRLVPD